MSRSPQIFPHELEAATQYYVMQAKEDEWEKKYNLRKQVYIDTYDAIRLIQGVWGLWEYDRERGNRENTDAYKFKKYLFESPNAIAHSFMFKGKLGTLHLLPPHQDELAQKIRNHKSLFFSRDINDLTTQLWRELNLLDLINESNNLTLDRVKPYLKELKAHDLYVAKDLLSIPYWYDRYNKLFKQDQTIVWDDSTYNFSDITKSSDFEKILTVLDEERNKPSMSKSNFVDSIAFCLLKKRLENFQHDKTLNTPLPVFFVSQPGTYKALKKLIDEEGWFLYNFDKDPKWKISFPVVRPADYFVLDAIFSFEDQKNSPLHSLFVNLRSTFDRELGDYALLNKILGKGGKEDLENKIDSLIKEEFFVKIWAEHEGYKEMLKAIEAHQEFIKIAEKEKERNEKELNAIRSEIKRDSNNFELVNDIMDQLLRLGDSTDKDYLEMDNLDVFADLSMVRFSFTKECRIDIQNYVTNLLRTRGTEDFKLEARALLSDIMDGIENFNTPQNRQPVVRLTVGLAVLWVFNKYDLITRIGQRLNLNTGEKSVFDFPNYQIPLIYAAVLSTNEGLDNRLLAEQLATCIGRKFGKNSEQPRYTTWLGLAYVWWNIWFKHHNDLEMPEEMGKAAFIKCQNEPQFEFVQMALRFSEDVIAYLRQNKNQGLENKTSEEREETQSQRNHKFCYAINMHLFLTVLYGSKEKLLSDSTERLVRELEREQGLHLWHSRYYDTCARYYYRRALLADSEKTFDDMLNLAEKDNEECAKATNVYESINYNNALKKSIILKRALKFKGWKQKSRLIN